MGVKSAIDQNLSGTLSINNMDYKVLCECGNTTPKITVEKSSDCEVKSINIVTSRSAEGYTPDIIRDIIDTPKRQSFVNVAETPFFCLDGRNSDKALYTPGGDFGEFLLALHVFEGLTNNLSASDVLNLFENYLK